MIEDVRLYFARSSMLTAKRFLDIYYSCKIMDNVLQMFSRDYIYWPQSFQPNLCCVTDWTGPISAMLLVSECLWGRKAQWRLAVVRQKHIHPIASPFKNALLSEIFIQRITECSKTVMQSHEKIWSEPVSFDGHSETHMRGGPVFVKQKVDNPGPITLIQDWEETQLVWVSIFGSFFRSRDSRLYNFLTNVLTAR